METLATCTSCGSRPLDAPCHPGCAARLEIPRPTAASRPPSDATAAAWSGRLSGAYLLLGVVAIICYEVVPPFAGSKWLFQLVGLSAAAAISVGVIRYRPRPVLPWFLFIVAQVVFVGGDFFYYTFDLTLPTPADGLYLSYYPLQVVGLLLLIRSRTPGKDRAGLLDALIITVGFALLSWVYLIAPYTHHAGDSYLSRFVSMAYPTMDVLLLAVAVRLVIGKGGRPLAFYLLTASILCLVLTDVAYGIVELTGTYNVGGGLDAGWMSAYLLWGAAALHPSMREMSQRAPVGDAALSRKRLLLLAAATLVAPATLVVNSQWPTEGFNVPVAAGASAALFVLVLIRMFGLLSDLRDAVARHDRAERRETTLRRAATALTAATDRGHIRSAAAEGALALTQELAEVHVAVETCDGRPDPPPVAPAPPGTLVVALSTQAALYGRLVVSSTSQMPTDVADGLHTLGAQIAMALESTALTEGLSRQRSEARVGALVQNSSDVIIVLDADLVIRYVTPSVTQVLGHRPEDLVGIPMPSLVTPAGEATWTDCHAWFAARSSRTGRAELRMRRGDGQLTDVEAVCTDLLDNPSVNGIVVTVRDITDRKALESGWQQHIHELEELDRIRGEFVATVSHELRTPLTSIIGETEVLADGDHGVLTSGQARSLEVIGRNSDRLLTLIEDLLTLNRVETGSLSLHREPTLVAHLLDGVRSQVGPPAAAKRVALELLSCPDAETVVVDRDQVTRALLNLLMNAVKFTPEGGTVTLRAQREGPDLVFTVADTGVGIPEDEQDRLFTRFFRSSVATSLAIPGTGLGLVIVKQIVEDHGGTISIDSTPDIGTTVTVSIPVGNPPGTHADAA